MPRILIRTRRRLLLAAFVTCAALALMATVVLFAITSIPGWYTPRAVDHGQLSRDKREAVTLIDAISRKLNQNQSIEISLGIVQLNRWITARDQLALNLIPALNGFERPVIAPTASGLRVGLLRAWKGWQFVVSFDLTWKTTPQGVVFELEHVSLGQLPIPAAWILERETRIRWGLAGDQPHTWIWPNGKRSFQVSTATLNDQTLRLRLTPR